MWLRDVVEVREMEGLRRDMLGGVGFLEGEAEGLAMLKVLVLGGHLDLCLLLMEEELRGRDMVGMIEGS
jgi:hypothetical protein